MIAYHCAILQNCRKFIFIGLHSMRIGLYRERIDFSIVHFYRVVLDVSEAMRDRSRSIGVNFKFRSWNCLMQRAQLALLCKVTIEILSEKN